MFPGTLSGMRTSRSAMNETSPDPIPEDLSRAFREAVNLYANWTPSGPEPEVWIGGASQPVSAVSSLVEDFHDRLPDDVLDSLMLHVRDVRYTLLRQRLYARQSYAAGALCLRRLIQDRKTFGGG
jgi:hypothetical protein